MRRLTTTHLALPAATSGALMATYLLLRPYGDHGSGTTQAAATAFADPRWVIAHLCGALALANLARLALRLHDLDGSLIAQVARWAGLGGAVLTLPYYGAETFALHAIGRSAAEHPDRLELVPAIRDNPVALSTFGIGLLLLAVSAGLVAWAWHRGARSLGRRRWAAWPLAGLVALVLPQYYLPPIGRMAFGVAYLAATALLVAAVTRGSDAKSAGRSLPEPRESRATA